MGLDVVDGWGGGKDLTLVDGMGRDVNMGGDGCYGDWER